jgi:hypothetical protein
VAGEAHGETVGCGALGLVCLGAMEMLLGRNASVTTATRRTGAAGACGTGVGAANELQTVGPEQHDGGLRPTVAGQMLASRLGHESRRRVSGPEQGMQAGENLGEEGRLTDGPE